MTVTIDKAGRVGIPAGVRDRLGLRAGTALDLSVEDAAIRPSNTTADIGNREINRDE